MFGWFIVTSLQFIAIVGSATLLMNIAGANMYDVREIKRKRQLDLNSHALRYKNRRLISVIITAHNDEQVVARSIDSILKSSYRKFEIIVIDNVSEDDTSLIVKQYIKRYPKRHIKLHVKRKASNKLAAVSSGYQEYCTGEVILVVGAGDEVDKRALANANRYFNSDPEAAIINPKYAIESTFSSLGLFQKYQTLLSHPSKKLNSISNTDYVFEEKVFYRRDVFRYVLKEAVKTSSGFLSVTHPGNKKVRSHYASDVIIRVQPALSLRGLFIRNYYLQSSRILSLSAQRRLFFSRNSDYTIFLTWLRLPFAVCLSFINLLMPILLTYFIFLAVHLHEPTFLLASWAMLTIFLIFSIWGEERLKLTQKVTYSLGIPITYGIFYALSVLQFFVIVKTVTIGPGDHVDH